MTRQMLLNGALALMIAVLTLPAVGQTASVTEQEAHAIGVDAYLYF